MASDASNDVIILDESEEEDGGIELMEVEEFSTSSSPKPGSSEAQAVKGDSLVSGYLAPATRPPEALTSESKEQSEQSDHDWDIILIEDDDDDKPRVAPEKMECFRCPNKKVGTFRNEKKYWTHISRHILPDSFSCVTCQRPFPKLAHCLSHELRVHGTPLGCNIGGKVISTAKSCVNEDQRAKSKEDKKLNEIDYEDVRFYDNHFVCSSSMYPYRGPKVKSRLESYEIQHVYSSRRPKSSRTNQVAKLALVNHEENVQRKTDVFRLGKFSDRRHGFVARNASK